MLFRLSMLAVLASLGVLVATDTAEACHKHAVTTYYVPYHDPCHWHCHGPVYVVSPPPVPLYGADPAILRVVPLGKGVIVEFTVPSGVDPKLQSPPVAVNATKTGGDAEFSYTGYNVKHVHPTVPGGTHLVYSVFLLPTKAGKLEVKVDFVLADGKTQSHGLGFEVKP